ncbi:hypothetical protein F-VV10_0020 [Faustovirus]|nr:hypothetical protein F-VV10_0020 [Faustovirus]
MANVANQINDPTHQHRGQKLIDIAAKMADAGVDTVPVLLSTTTHNYHRMAVFAAVMCDNINMIKAAIPPNDAIGSVLCCKMATQSQGKLPNILRVDNRNTLTLTCVEYDAIECFKYLHLITNEDLETIVKKAVRYGAQKILAHLAATTDSAESIMNTARKSGINLRICP